MIRKYALILVVVLSGTGMAHAGLFSDDEAHKKIIDLQQQVKTLETRLATLEGVVQNQGLVELLSQVETLKGDMAKMRGQLEVQTHDLESVQKRQKDFYVDLDTRLRHLESAGPASPVTGVAGSAAGKTGAANPAVAADPAAEAKTYEAAWSLFKAGNYQGAITGFLGFLKSYPNSNLASSAQYWIGNSYFALGDFKSAIAAQQKLIKLYPDSQKVPDAMLNLASCHQGLGDNGAARKTLEDLVAKFPLSSAADLAQKRLGNLR